MNDIRVISIGDLVTDYYYINNEIFGLCGGMSSHNIISNLSIMGKKTLTFGVCGNDLSGKIAIKSLKDIGVNTKHIKILNNINTKSVHISYKKDNKIYSHIHCPFCNKMKWYDNSLIDYNYVLNNIKENDILVFDNLNDINQKIIDNTKNIKFIDIGHIRDFNKLEIDKLREKINNKFKIININNAVYDYLINKFNLTIKDIYNLFNAELIIITEGKEGAKFIFKEKVYTFKLINIEKEIDATGAGDAFFSSIINDVIDNELIIDDKKFNEWFNNATKLTSKVVKKLVQEDIY